MRSVSGWALSSERALAALVALALTAPAPAAAVVYHSQQEALALAFPDSDRIERRDFLLDDAQAARVEKLASAPLESRIATLHAGWRGETLLGYAVIDVHNVRTLPEALMVVLAPDGAVRSVRLLAFHEPTDYRPSDRWYDQFAGKRLGPDLQLLRGVHAIAGATLSARAATRSVRRALALYRVLVAPPPED